MGWTIFVHRSFDEDSQGCIIEGAMIDISTPGSCSDCAIDMTATIIGLEVVEDLGACDGGEAIVKVLKVSKWPMDKA